MCLGTLHDAVVSSAFVAGVFLVSILQAGDWARVSSPVSDYFNMHHYHRSATELCKASCPKPQIVVNL